MASTKEIKSRIKSVKNTKKITKAMELVAASKMKRAVSSTLASRLYAQYSWEILKSISQNSEKISHPFFIGYDQEKILFVLITSNRGLCGGYNSQVLKKTILKLKELNSIGSNEIDVVTIGKKGGIGMRRIGQNIIASFDNLPEHIDLMDTVPISRYIVEQYKTGNYKKVYVAYTDFISALNQKPSIKQLLPISKKDLLEAIESIGEDKIQKDLDSNEKTDYLFEGDQELLIDALGEKISRMQIYQMLLESNASEQSSRMVAMKNASEAAGEMIDDLTLVFNKARQANITQEISEISAGMSSMLTKSDIVLNNLEELIDTEHGIIRPKIYTAHKIPQEIIKEIEQELKNKYKAEEVIITEIEDPKILGGIKIQIANEIIDLSLQKKVAQLKKHLLN
jgi:F-type H+-transporting ATPase subunit gamma